VVARAGTRLRDLVVDLEAVALGREQLIARVRIGGDLLRTGDGSRRREQRDDSDDPSHQAGPQSGSENVKTELPDLIETYCLPFTS
jgi:hypothetical protein